MDVQSSRSEKDFSLLEGMAVIGIMSIVMAMAILGFCTILQGSKAMRGWIGCSQSYGPRASAPSRTAVRSRLSFLERTSSGLLRFGQWVIHSRQQP